MHGRRSIIPLFLLFLGFSSQVMAASATVNPSRPWQTDQTVVIDEGTAQEIRLSPPFTVFGLNFNNDSGKTIYLESIEFCIYDYYYDECSDKSIRLPTSVGGVLVHSLKRFAISPVYVESLYDYWGTLKAKASFNWHFEGESDSYTTDVDFSIDGIRDVDQSQVSR